MPDQGIVRLIACVALTLFVPHHTMLADDANDSRRQPNIVFILLDNVGKDWIRCYGSQENETPNIDRLCYTGMKFRHFYVTPVCSTTRTMLLTGRYPFRTGWHTHHDTAIYGGGFLDWNREVTFARVLRDAGYRTAISGKWQINDLFDPAQADALAKHGFQEHCIWPEAKPGLPAHKKRYWDPYVIQNGRRIDADGKYGPDVFTDYSIDFIKRNRQRPFLLYQSAILTHIPVTTTPHHRDEDATPREKFAGMLRYADHLIGRLVQALDDNGIRENTWVFIATDNGTDTGTDQGMPQSLGGRRHGQISDEGIYSLTERGINMPLIVNGPEWIATGCESDALVNAADVFPTLVELAGAELPPGVTIDGQSFAAVLRDNHDGSWRRPWTLTQYADQRAIRDDRFKLYSSGQFFDLAADPLEKIDLGNAALTEPDAVASHQALQRTLADLPENAEWPWTFRSISARKIRSQRDAPRRQKWAAGNHRPPAELASLFSPPDTIEPSITRPQEAKPPTPPRNFDNSAPDASAAEWRRRRVELKSSWEASPLGLPQSIDLEGFTQLAVIRRGPITRRQLQLKIDSQKANIDAVMLVPDGDGPFPAVVIPHRTERPTHVTDQQLPPISWLLSERGFVTLTLPLAEMPSEVEPPAELVPTPLTSPSRDHHDSTESEREPNLKEVTALRAGYTFLKTRPEVYPQRIAVHGRSAAAQSILISAGVFEAFECVSLSNIDGSLIDSGEGLDLIKLTSPRPLLITSDQRESSELWAALEPVLAIHRLGGFRDRLALLGRSKAAGAEDAPESAIRFLEWWLQEK